MAATTKVKGMTQTAHGRSHPLEDLLTGSVQACSYDPDSKKLTIRGATKFPTEILAYSDDIEILDMSQGALSALPRDMGRLRRLKVAFFSNNRFTAVPPQVASCPSLGLLGMKSCQIAEIAADALPSQLRWLTLTDNHLQSVPASIGTLSRLEKLLLAGNELAELPQELLACHALRLLRLGSNALAQAPDWLFALPELAWYGDAGNPYNPVRVPLNHRPTEFDWSDLGIGERIGESAKNVVYQAQLTATGETVAVKIYGGVIGSDGAAADEIAMSLMAGDHPQLVSAYGRLRGVPDDRVGLVMRLVPPEYAPLALPPSFNTCTRDTFPAETRFSLGAIRRIVTGVSAAGQHLHERGIMHGDLYGHNILSDAAGASLLGDFGAASPYDRSEGTRRERIDVRALGYLIDDLLSRCASEDGSDELRHLRDRCLSQDESQRPVFADINVA